MINFEAKKCQKLPSDLKKTFTALLRKLTPDYINYRIYSILTIEEINTDKINKSFFRGWGGGRRKKMLTNRL